MKPFLPLFAVSLSILGYSAIGGPREETRKVNFDREVMPILGQRCFKCHGPDAAKVAAGLRLDLRDSALQVGAIIPGKPADSLLVQRVSASDESRMPPPDSGVKPLTRAEIETLRLWIQQGAVYEKHWAYVPPQMPALPKVSKAQWCRNLVDRFVLAKLDEAGLKPEPEADRDTLALRAAETLTGLPPAAEELAAFRSDAKAGAYERYVDRLLAKPSYGEHQARYWLDAVRYGDTHGLQLDNERGIYPYRDWVVRAFNQDLPFDKFAQWQLAGDLLPRPTTEQLIATGYVRMNLTSNEGGAIPEEFLARNTFDRVDTTGTVFLGLTVGCAKCHDHKYDPIKQRDYYGLYAFFNNTKDEPLDGNIALPPPVVKAATPEQEARLASMTLALSRLEYAVDTSGAVSYLAQHHNPPPLSHGWQISPVYTGASFDAEFEKAEAAEPGQSGEVAWKDLKFEPGTDYNGIIGKDRSAIYIRGVVSLPKARKITFGVSSDDAVKVWLNGKLIHANKVSRGVVDAIDQVTGEFRAGDNELLVKVVNGAGPDGLNIRLIDATDMLIDEAVRAAGQPSAGKAAKRQLAKVFLEYGPASSAALEYRRIEKERAALDASIPMSLIAQERPMQRPTFVLKRGLYDQKGEPVVRHVPAVLEGGVPDFPGQAKDRLWFARWLTSRQNPLFARVFVNRLWQQHFGVAIVRTVEDFGSQGEWPMNQPLLDYLAVSFAQNGMSVKKLNRLIVTSAAFRQRSGISAEKLRRDPENRLVSRGPRFRLDAEVIRDKALFAGGLLVQGGGGKGFKPYQPDGIWEATSDPASGTHFYARDKGDAIYRRSLYMFWKRTAPPPAMITFDAPLRDTCIVRRSSTNTPLQALTLENETAFLEASRAMAERVLARGGQTADAMRLRTAYGLALGRAPRAREVQILTLALASYRARFRADASSAERLLGVGDSPSRRGVPPSEHAAWMLICSTLMNTDEFLTLH